MATFQPPPSTPTISSAGIRASRKKVWVKPCSPVSFLIGRVSTPSIFIGARKKVRPSYLREASARVRASRIMYRAYFPNVVQILEPFTTYWSPSRTALVWALPRSEPFSGSEKP